MNIMIYTLLKHLGGVCFTKYFYFKSILVNKYVAEVFKQIFAKF